MANVDVTIEGVPLRNLVPSDVTVDLMHDSSTVVMHDPFGNYRRFSIETELWGTERGGRVEAIGRKLREEAAKLTRTSIRPSGPMINPTRSVIEFGGGTVWITKWKDRQLELEYQSSLLDNDRVD